MKIKGVKLDTKNIIEEGKETAEKVAEKIKTTAEETGKIVNKGLFEHGIDIEKLSTSLVNDAKNASSFLVGATKIVSDKIINKVVPPKDERTMEERKQDAINKIRAMQAANEATTKETEDSIYINNVVDKTNQEKE